MGASFALRAACVIAAVAAILACVYASPLAGTLCAITSLAVVADSVRVARRASPPRAEASPAELTIDVGDRR